MLDFIKRAFRKTPAKLYGLDHAVLNIQLPPQSMWMNVGYWEVLYPTPMRKSKSLELIINMYNSTQTTSQKHVKHS